MSKIIIEIPDRGCFVKGALAFLDRSGHRLCPTLNVERFYEPGTVSRFRLGRALKPLRFGQIVGSFVPDYEKD